MSVSREHETLVTTTELPDEPSVFVGIGTVADPPRLTSAISPSSATKPATTARVIKTVRPNRCELGRSVITDSLPPDNDPRCSEGRWL
jgi:hypothetical protein